MNICKIKVQSSPVQLEIVKTDEYTHHFNMRGVNKKAVCLKETSQAKFQNLKCCLFKINNLDTGQVLKSNSENN